MTGVYLKTFNVDFESIILENTQFRELQPCQYTMLDELDVTNRKSVRDDTELSFHNLAIMLTLSSITETK